MGVELVWKVLEGSGIVVGGRKHSTALCHVDQGGKITSLRIAVSWGDGTFWKTGVGGRGRLWGREAGMVLEGK